MKPYTIAIESDLRASGEPTKRVSFSKPRLSTSSTNKPQKADLSSFVEARGIRFASERLEAIHSSLNNMAQSIRFTDRRIGRIETFIDKMKARLKTILKQYPPFPPGSEERVRLLRSFNAFRKQIDQLTIPPREDFAKMVMAGQDVFAQSGDHKISEKVHRQRVHSSPQGIDIPAIGENAPDDEVFAFLENLDAFSEQVRDRRTDLAEDAAIIGKLLGDGRVGDTRETDTELKSLEIRDAIKAESVASLTDAQTQLMELL